MRIGGSALLEPFDAGIQKGDGPNISSPTAISSSWMKRRAHMETKYSGTTSSKASMAALTIGSNSVFSPRTEALPVKLRLASHPNSYATVGLGAFMAANQLQNKFRLNAGQHQRAAILRMNGLSPEASARVFLNHHLSNPEQKSTTWAVEMYDQDYLTANPITLTRLQMNEIVNHKANTDGDNFTLLHRTLQAVPDDRRKDI